MFELACHTWGFSDLALEDAVQTIARLGFNYLDLGSGPHLDIDAAAKNPRREVTRISILLDDFHLQITDLYLLLPALASADEGRRLYEVKLFERLLPFILDLGVPGVTLSPGIETPEITEARMPRPEAIHLHPPERTEENAELVTYTRPHPSGGAGEPANPGAFENAIDSFQRIVELTEDTDLRISIEPHLDSVAATPDRALALVEAVPGLSLTLDWAQFTAQGIAAREIEPLLQHAAHVQLRQAARGRLQTPYHEGTLDFRQVLSLLIANDYRGAISIEYMNRAGWHGLAALDIVRETGLVRDEIRLIRHELLGSA
ncbi:MAG: sugar phosphate isomerase/epimerase [Anaerolineae bacterium]|nr:sugar phosphate isomerase/epimerase [Anaerolineae bacterium]